MHEYRQAETQNRSLYRERREEEEPKGSLGFSAYRPLNGGAVQRTREGAVLGEDDEFILDMLSLSWLWDIKVMIFGGEFVKQA